MERERRFCLHHSLSPFLEIWRAINTSWRWIKATVADYVRKEFTTSYTFKTSKSVTKGTAMDSIQRELSTIQARFNGQKNRRLAWSTSDKRLKTRMKTCRGQNALQIEKNTKNQRESLKPQRRDRPLDHSLASLRRNPLNHPINVTS